MTEQKYVLYQDAAGSAPETLGPDGVTEDFMEANDDFIAEGCTDQGKV